MIVPFGLAMLMGLVTGGRLLMTCAVTVQKWAVLPLSAVARASGGMIVGGGPTRDTELEDRQIFESLRVTLGKLSAVSTVGNVVVVGSPRRQLADGGAAVASWRGRLEEMVLLPPFILKAVASSLWPLALRRQVSDV